jgi:diacylglycerol diphosphate phosphatase / phosphatidate phosphatase
LVYIIIPANLPFSHLQQKMPEIQLGVHTIRSHGARVARIHMHDWLILLLLVVIDAVLNIIEPFHRFVGEGMLTDLRYPLKDNTIPFWAVPVCFASINCILLYI